jgi:DNA repair protein RadD
MELRPNQLNCLHHIRSSLLAGERDLLIQSSTGSGKTETFINFCLEYVLKNPSARIAIILSQVILVKQTEKRFNKYGASVGVICGSLGREELDKQVTVCSIQTLKKFDIKFDLIIRDECHKNESKSFQDFLESQTQAIKIGFTATPFTTTGYLYGENKSIKELTYSYGINDSIRDGILCPFRFKASVDSFDVSNIKISMGEYDQDDLGKLVDDDDKIIKQVQYVLSAAKDRKCIVYSCINKEHLYKLKDILEDLGEECCIINSDLSQNEREKELEKFESGKVKNLISITIVSEGYDHPPIDCIVNMRPTKSPVLYVQLFGRGLRNYPGKTDLLFLDFGGVVQELGHPNDPLIKEKGKSKPAKPLDAINICPSCCAILFTKLKVCPECMHQIIKEEEKIITGNLTVKPYMISIQEVTEKIIDVKKWDINKDYTSSKGNKGYCVKYFSSQTSFYPAHIEYFIPDWSIKKITSETMSFTLMPKRLFLKKQSDTKYFNVLKREYY